MLLPTHPGNTGACDMWHNVPIMPSETRVYDTKAKEAVKSLAAELGFDLVGVTSADPFYEAEEITLERVTRRPHGRPALVPRRQG